jgi:hypothetical protein
MYKSVLGKINKLQKKYREGITGGSGGTAAGVGGKV